MNQFFRLANVVVVLAIGLTAASIAQHSDAQDSDSLDPQRVQYFESRIRPALVKYCLDCHSRGTERSGGLLLDSAAGWREGGDSGPVIDLGQADSSLFMQAISYSNPKLQMPPDGRLPNEVIADFRKWIEQGALDPRQDTVSFDNHKSRALSVEDSHKHWAYRSLGSLDRAETQVPGAAIDRFVADKLSRTTIQVAPMAAPAALVRRLYFDLTGLPPTAEQLGHWSENLTDQRYSELVEHLLASPHYGEHFARRWMDVVRYADSIALRGFVHKNAWRYRDYLVEAYNQDRSFQDLIREQVAGDLLPAADQKTRTRQLIATAFLALGNTNLETQDKAQLDMDYLDEQLDVIGAAFLGQTIGCARCHDHKFDPIPTRDYYALAGILKSATGMKHANVSEWIEQPLPLEESEQAEFDQLESLKANLSKQVQHLKKQLDSITSKSPRFIQPADLPGVVVDSAQATLVGSWVSSNSVGSIVGETYLHDGNKEKGLKSATFEPESLPPGEYEVLLAYQSAENRATNVVVNVSSADGDKEVVINQRIPAPELNLWYSLGRFRFEANGQKYVLVSNVDTDGHVIVVAVLFLPVSKLKDGSLAATLQPERESNDSTANSDSAKQQIKQLEAQISEAQKKLDSRPKYLTVLEGGKGEDIPVHIRGDVHKLGEVVPRGFLTALKVPSESSEPPTRRHLANWLSDNSNPLTARVYANRVWAWLIGVGIVATPNNFGTTGSAPTHPELLDWLAGRLIDSGWSTKALVREIVHSQAYRRAITEPCRFASEQDPDNRFLWRRHLRRLTVESLRDAMLTVSGELDATVGGSLIRPGTKDDYNYVHSSTRRSIYQPVFRNSLPELFDEFDFANPSFSIDARARSTVAPQGLALMQDPWVTARAKQTAIRYASILRSRGLHSGIELLYLDCFARLPTDLELRMCLQYLDVTPPPDISVRTENDDANPVQAETPLVQIEETRLEQLIQALYASLDFRFLD